MSNVSLGNWEFIRHSSLGNLALKKNASKVEFMIPSTRKKIYTVQEVADILGVYKRTVINYEQKGIFPLPKRNPINNWREYTEEDIQELKRILNRE